MTEKLWFIGLSTSKGPILWTHEDGEHKGLVACFETEDAANDYILNNRMSNLNVFPFSIPRLAARQVVLSAAPNTLQ